MLDVDATFITPPLRKEGALGVHLSLAFRLALDHLLAARPEPTISANYGTMPRIYRK